MEWTSAVSTETFLSHSKPLETPPSAWLAAERESTMIAFRYQLGLGLTILAYGKVRLYFGV